MYRNVMYVGLSVCMYVHTYVWMDGCICVCMHVYMQIHCKSKSLEVFQPESNMINKPKETGLVLFFFLPIQFM